jgi:DNA-binding transcriptional ArsR family regulator
MQHDNAQLTYLQAAFKECTQILAAMGDENRQLIIMALIYADCDGLRVGELTAQTHLSRPAVSHHLKILKDAGIVRIFKEKTMNYYYLDPTSNILQLKNLIAQLERLLTK